MVSWPDFRQFFSIRPPSEDDGESLLSEGGEDTAYQVSKTFSNKKAYEDIKPSPPLTPNDIQCHHIRFDNMFRLWFALASVLVCFGLWVGDVIAKFSPIGILFCFYIGCQFTATWLLAKKTAARQINYFLCSIDLISLSIAVTLSGGATSPLYFIYFVPLIIQAFHRDWGLTLLYSYGAVFLYTITILLTVDNWSSVLALNIGARVFFIFLTVSLATFAVRLLINREEKERRRLSRTRFLTHASQLLNTISTPGELPKAIETLVKQLNTELNQEFEAWSRIFLIQKDQRFMRAIADPENDKPELNQELQLNMCPAIKSSTPLLLGDAEKETGCPTESFSFMSHLCVPVMGSENESFGVIFAGSPQPYAFKRDEVQFIKFLGRSLGLTVQRLHKMDELRLRIELNSCATANFVGSMRSLEETYKTILDGIRSMLNADQASLMIWDQSKGKLMVKDVQGPHQNLERDQFLNFGEGTAGQVIETGFPNWTSGENFDFPINGKKSPFKSLLCLPMFTIKGEPLGVLNARMVTERRIYSLQEIDVASTYATRAATAVENAFLHEKQRTPHQKTSKNQIQPPSTDQKAA